MGFGGDLRFGETAAGAGLRGADEICATIRDDFPNEDGVPNHAPDPTQGQVDNHDMLTGSSAQGKLYPPARRAGPVVEGILLEHA
jgi:hypothetical protein